LPGIEKFRKSYKNISSKLDKQLNLNIDLNLLPQNTMDAISYGIIASIVNLLKQSVKNKKIFFTGGDGAFLARFFDNAIVDNLLVFKGMQKVIKST
jgi:type III pantothenate kinase